MIRDDEAININKANNGWRVTHTWEEKFTDRGGKRETEWQSDDYVYLTLEEALKQVTKIAEAIK